MQVLKRIAVVAFVLALPLATTVTAFGVKPAKPDKPTTTTTTVPTEPGLFGSTCEDSSEDYAATLASHSYTETADGFSVRLSGKKDILCLDVLPTVAGIWTVTIVGDPGTTALNRILMVPRDSIAPGDSCGGVDLRRVALPLQQPLPHPDDPRFDELPSGYVNACGTAYGEWVDFDDDDTRDAGELIGVVMSEVAHPLAFQVLMEAAGATSTVTLTVQLPTAQLP